MLHKTQIDLKMEIGTRFRRDLLVGGKWDGWVGGRRAGGRA